MRRGCNNIGEWLRPNCDTRVEHSVVAIVKLYRDVERYVRTRVIVIYGGYMALEDRLIF